MHLFLSRYIQLGMPASQKTLTSSWQVCTDKHHSGSCS